MLCRVVSKPPHQNSPSEIGLSCCAEESVGVAVRQVGVQCDGCAESDVVEAKVCDDSFSRWITKELGEVADLNMQSSPGISWSTDECQHVIDDTSLSPSLSQDQLFSINDFSPKWAYAESEIEVLILWKIYIIIIVVVKKCQIPLQSKK